MKHSIFHLFAVIALLGFAACADVPELPYPTPSDDDPTVSGSLPYTSNSLNDFTVQTLKGSGWSLGSTYAKATGYADNVTTASQTWLVSPAINTTMKGTEGIVVNFQYVLRYVKSSTDVKGYHRVLASTDYAGDVTTATWTDLGFEGYEMANNTTWTFYAASPISLPETLWNEEKVYLAFYFECTDANSTTWELKELSVAEGTGSGSGGNDNPPTPPADVTEATVAAFIAAPVSTTAWYQLTGTVGTLKDGDIYGNFDLTDATGTVYVYGLLAEKGGAKQQFQTLLATTGLAAGDKITLIGQRGDYNGKTEVLNAYLVQIVEKGEGGNGGGGNDNPPLTGTNLLKNGDFESWSNGQPTGWQSASTASSATLTQSTTSHSGSYSVSVGHDANYNKRLAYKEITLLPGSYTMRFYAQGATAAASVRPGYAIVENGSIPSGTGYQYGDYTNDIATGKWTEVRHSFTLTSQTTVNILVMNPKNSGSDVLIDDFELITSDGGLASGGEDDNDTGGGTDPATLPYTADFTKSACNFKAQDVTLSGGLTYVWAQSASYGWKASAYKVSNQAAESWLVSPTIDLTSATAPVMTVNQALNHLYGATATAHVNICVSTDYAGDATTATWTTLTIPTWPSGSDWTFVDSGNISLSAFAGKKVTVALHYQSTTDTAPTWEIKTLTVQ